MQSEISWFTPPVGSGVGYGVAAINLILALQDRKVKVSYDTSEPLCQVSFVQPEWYRGDHRQYQVGYTPWESTEIPDFWPHYMQQKDEIWTTSNFCKEIFEGYKVNDVIRVVPHGIDPEVWSIVDRTLADKFIFLHVGGGTARKGAQRVADAFLDLFEGNENVILLMKSNQDTEARWKNKGFWGGNIGNHPQVQVYTAQFPEDALVQLYHQAHCLVYPTNGEGFGFIPFQGIATGLPTICTNATGCADFAELSIPLNSSPSDGVGVHLGRWVDPDLDDLRDKMKWVYDNFEEAKIKAMQGAKIIHSTQTWHNIADQVIEIFGDKLGERVE